MADRITGKRRSSYRDVSVREIMKSPKSKWDIRERVSVTRSYILKDRGVTQGRSIVEGSQVVQTEDQDSELRF